MKYKDIIERLMPYSEEEVEISTYQDRVNLEVRFFKGKGELICGIKQIINEVQTTRGTLIIESV